MSVNNTETMQVIPFARAERIVPQITPTHYGYVLCAVSGDSSGGVVTLRVDLPAGYFFRIEALSVFASDAAADVGNCAIFSNPEWVQDALPVLNVLFETAMPMVAHAATRSHAAPRSVAAFVNQLRRIPLGRLNGQTTTDGLRARLENNVNLQSYTLEIYASAWELPSFGLAGFLDKLILS